MTLTKQQKQTCKNVRYFFKNDFEKYKQLATLADLKSISYNGTKVSTNSNIQEDKTITASYYKNIVDTIKTIIERIQNEQCKKIMKYRYFEHLSYWQIAQKMQYGESTVKQLTNKALLIFADMLAMVTDIDLRKEDYIEKH